MYTMKEQKRRARVELGGLILAAMKRKGWSRGNLAHKLSVETIVITHMVNGTTNPKRGEFVGAINILGFSKSGKKGAMRLLNVFAHSRPPVVVTRPHHVMK